MRNMTRYHYIAILSALLLAVSSCDQEETSPEIKVFPELSLETSDHQLIVTDQSSGTVRIYDQPTRCLLWCWSASDSNILPAHRSWLKLTDECKPVLDCSCLLITASDGGAALVEIGTGKVRFYAYPGENPHSAEILPDGNIVVSSSKGYVTLYKYDPTTAYVPKPMARYELAGAHNAVWDARRNCLWVAGDAEMVKYAYDGSSLTVLARVALPALWGHDLVPYRDEDRLVLTTGSSVNFFDPQTMKFTTADCFKQGNIKSVSFGPMAICTTPTTSWWTPEVSNFHSGERVFFGAALQIYKARWRVPNTFSYGDYQK